MANPYFTFTPRFVPFDRVKAEPINNQFDAIVAAFDLLPPNSGSLNLGASTLGVESGAGNAYVVTMPKTRTVNTEGDEVVFKATHQNSGASTLQVDAIAAVPLVRFDGSAVQAADILAGTFYTARFNATTASFAVTSPTLQTIVGVISFAAPTTDIDVIAPAAGAATTVLRSDARLRLSQSITPTWLNPHTFNAAATFASTISVAGAATLASLGVTANATVGGTLGVTSNATVGGTLGVTSTLLVGGPATFQEQGLFTLAGTNATPSVRLSSTLPMLGLNQTGAALDEKNWQFYASGGDLVIGTLNDAANTAAEAVRIARTGTVVDSIAFSATALTLNGNALVTVASSPVWSGLHTFNAVATFANPGTATTPSLRLTSTLPILELDDTDGASNEKTWQLRMDASLLRLFAVSDDNSASNFIVSFARSGASPTTVTWAGTDFIIGSTNITSTSVGSWSGTQTFTNSFTSGNPGAVTLSAAAPLFEIDESGAAANNRRWWMNATSEQLQFQLANDARTSSTSWLNVDRAANVVSCVAFPLAITNGASFRVGTFTGIGLGTGITNNLGWFRTTGSGACALILQHNEAPVTAPLRIAHDTVTSGSTVYAAFARGNGTAASLTGEVGSISHDTGTGLTSYNTTSGRDKKRNIRNAASCGAILDRIPVRAFEWIDTGNTLTHWFVAEELDAVFPVAVTRPRMLHGDWFVDPTKLIPLLLKEIQELRARMAAVEGVRNGSDLSSK